VSQGILVFIEQRNGKLRKASLEALSEALRQVGKVGGDVIAIVIGETCTGLLPDIAKYQPSKILVAEGAEFSEYSTEGYANALTEAVKKTDPKYVFSANTAMSKDLMPRVSARLDAPCVTDVVDLAVEDSNLVATKPLYSAKAYGQFEFQNNVSFLTLRPNIFSLTEAKSGDSVPIEKLSVAPARVRAKVIETHSAEGQKVELTESPIVVSGGRGIKGPEHWGMLQALCDVLGASLGASRAVVDAGWIDHQHQVGQTGKTVSPQLYIACGISGAIQHLAGMSSSKVIVAINKDGDAPIFKLANYGLVGDVFEIVPKLTEEIRKLKES
jgi:electron transfer flavoprotein alpha subunit